MSNYVTSSQLSIYNFTTLPTIQSNSNIWSGTNTYNTNLSTSSITTTTSGNQFITKSIATSLYGSLGNGNT